MPVSVQLMKRLLSVSLAWSMSLAVLAQPAKSPFSESWSQTVARLHPAYGGVSGPPAKVKDAKPRYPPEARAARVDGIVILEVLIDEHGTVANARVVRSIPLLDRAALEAVSKWEFTVSKLNNGRPVPLVMTVTVNFDGANRRRRPPP
jgi:TonB family protein